MDASNRRERETDDAAQWWVRLGTRSPHEISQEDREAFTRWLRESPLHVAEMLHVAHVHDALARFKHWQEIPADAIDKNTVIPIDAMKPRSTSCSGRRGAVEGEITRGGGKKRLLALAATVAAVLVATAVLVPRIRGHVIATDLAERREVMLEDGSTVRLEPETTLRVKFKAHERHVVLDRGRALFHVAKDQSRPFLVQAEDTTVRAVGTAFGVERQRRGVIVTVAEGKVAVFASHALGASLSNTSAVGNSSSPRNAGGKNEGISAQREKAASREVFLTAGEQVTVQKSGSAEPVRKVDSTHELAWTEGRLVFDSTPLSEVVDQFNRYNHQQLRVDDPGLARRPVSGVFQATDPETLIAFIRAGMRVNVIRQNAREILIAPSNPN